MNEKINNYRLDFSFEEFVEGLGWQYITRIVDVKQKTLHEVVKKFKEIQKIIEEF